MAALLARPETKSGLTRGHKERTVRTLGARAIDGRSTVAKQLAAWRGDLIRELGGDVSTQQAAIIDLAVKTKLLLVRVREHGGGRA